MSSADVASSRKEEEEKEEEEEKDTLRVVSVIGREADNGLEWCPRTEEEEDQREVRQLLLPKRREQKKEVDFDGDDEVTTSKRNSIWRRLRRIVVDRSIDRYRNPVLLNVSFP